MDIEKLTADLEDIYHQVKSVNTGKVADYIPQLANVNPDLFGISVCTVDGKLINIGDTKEEFCMQSCAKILSYLLACNCQNSKKVHNHVGHEPSGRAFNEFCFNEDDIPHNPMINSGAIMMISMIDPDVKAMSDRYNTIRNFIKRMAGHVGYLGYDNSVYLSERQNAFKNRALANMMMDKEAFPSNTNIDETLDLYFQICSITTNTETAAIMAGTLANCGVCPINNDQVITPDLVQNCMTLMSTCGMYDFSGRFAFEVGIPAKSGVSGCIILAITGVAGICIWSPPLDKKGNSVRGVEVAKLLIKKYPHFHTYFNNESVAQKITKNDINNNDKRILTQKLIYSVSVNDLEQVKELLQNKHTDINDSDYDNRTPLHLAAVEGHFDMIKYLVENGANIDVKDRSGNTPYSEAQRQNGTTQEEQYASICKYLDEKYYNNYRSQTPIVSVTNYLEKSNKSCSSLLNVNANDSDDSDDSDNIDDIDDINDINDMKDTDKNSNKIKVKTFERKNNIFDNIQSVDINDNDTDIKFATNYFKSLDN
jgi:glutaminase